MGKRRQAEPASSLLIDAGWLCRQVLFFLLKKKNYKAARLRVAALFKFFIELRSSSIKTPAKTMQPYDSIAFS